jgi:hypothetical protein
MSLLDFYPELGTVLGANDSSMTYLGWRIFGYRYLHDEPELQVPVSKEDLLSALRGRFTEPDWSVSEEKGKLMLEHAETKFEVKVEVHGWDIEVAYDDGLKRETYLCELSSEGFAWKRMEHAHRQLFREVFRKLPWYEKVGGWIDDSRFLLTSSSNVEGRFEPFEVEPNRWNECPIPEKHERRRRRLLRMKPATSYLGTRIKSPARRNLTTGS